MAIAAGTKSSEVITVLKKIPINIREKVLEVILRKRKNKRKKVYHPPIYENGDTKKQLLARSRYLLFKPSSKWTEKQKQRANILFREFPELQHAYNISMMFRSWYENSTDRKQAKAGLKQWYTKVEEEILNHF